MVNAEQLRPLQIVAAWTWRDVAWWALHGGCLWLRPWTMQHIIAVTWKDGKNRTTNTKVRREGTTRGLHGRPDIAAAAGKQPRPSLGPGTGSQRPVLVVLLS